MSYKEMYFELFAKVTDVIEELEQIQAKTEQMYIDYINDEDNEE